MTMVMMSTIGNKINREKTKSEDDDKNDEDDVIASKMNRTAFQCKPNAT